MKKTSLAKTAKKEKQKVSRRAAESAEKKQMKFLFSASSAPLRETCFCFFRGGLGVLGEKLL
jgi:hypothetical protein